MKVGDLVRIRKDGITGLLFDIVDHRAGYCYRLYICNGGHTFRANFRFEELEVINEGR